MQLDRFTIKAREALHDARRLSSERHHPEIRPLHLLLALTLQDEGIVGPDAQSLAVNPPTMPAEPPSCGREGVGGTCLDPVQPGETRGGVQSRHTRGSGTSDKSAESPHLSENVPETRVIAQPWVDLGPRVDEHRPDLMGHEVGENVADINEQDVLSFLQYVSAAVSEKLSEKYKINLAQIII